MDNNPRIPLIYDWEKNFFRHGQGVQSSLRKLLIFRQNGALSYIFRRHFIYTFFSSEFLECLSGLSKRKFFKTVIKYIFLI